MITRIFLILLLSLHMLKGQEPHPFAQLYTELPTPNDFRNASGAPGNAYWQQKVDYRIKITLDDTLQRISGEETVTYHNQSPDALSFLWLQLDQNIWSEGSITERTQTGTVQPRMSFDQAYRRLFQFDGGYKIQSVTDSDGKPLSYTVVNTMMRIDLPQPLLPKTKLSFSISWWFHINDRMKIGGRTGYEYFESDNNYLYTMAQFFPRMCAYMDDEGWQTNQFLGAGEFTLEFGDYDVDIRVPSDHLVAATGELQNPKEVLTLQQLNRLEKARNEFKQPVIIANQEEAMAREKTRSKEYKTWRFSAKNVRDFAFASSRKFIWDAMSIRIGNRNVLAMSMYPKEGNPLWEQFSTKVVAHTLEWYSHYTIDYPYPVAWSINAKDMGMEYPMICFNGGRCEPDGTYSERTKYGMQSVIIHEVGHNFFPMIINSDERQWTWMDEGLNTYVQYLTEQQWERNYPSRRGPAYKIVDYMKGPPETLSPIMTNSESILQFGNNAYAKPATALNILRETIVGDTLFDFAFREYCRRWKFKHPSPADFFRTIEEASGVDLDWFWRGWFFGTKPVDIAIKTVKQYTWEKEGPNQKELESSGQQSEDYKSIGYIRNLSRIKETYEERDPSIRDMYSQTRQVDDQKGLIPANNQFKDLNKNEIDILKNSIYLTEVTFENVGGLVMPILLHFVFDDGSEEEYRIPAEIWRQNWKEVTKVFETAKKIIRIELDPYLETADIDRSNNFYPQQIVKERIELYREQQRKPGENPIQRNRKRP